MATITGRLADLASTMLMTSARVADVRRISPRFVTLELSADAFRTATWTPGAKLQLRTRNDGLALRTYTPTRWDPARGVTHLIGFTHGEGPATDWLRDVAVGDTAEVFGPRSSMNLSAVSAGAVFVGDESSVALACALRTVTTDVRHVFEATDPTELTAVLTDLGFGDQVTVLPTGLDKTSVVGSTRDLVQASNEPVDLVVSGDARTLHALRRAVRTWSCRPKSLKGKAYWAPGRTGLD